MEITRRRIPVILDTDIGDDIDDTWALAMMLNSPELDVKLIVSDTGNTIYRAKIIAKMLEAANRTDIPVGVGIPFKTKHYAQKEWVEGYQLSDYPGTVHRDGVGAVIETIMNSPEPVTLICIGPVPNIGEALKREPRITENARFVGMHGSIHKGYENSDTISPECNVVYFTSACQKVFTAPWEITITPLDTCGLVDLDGGLYQAILACTDPLVQAVIENYRIWTPQWETAIEPDIKSSTLFDTVAIHLAYSEEYLHMEELGIRVTDDGYTLIDEKAKRVRAAVEWKDLSGFKKSLAARLTGGRPRRDILSN